MSTSTQNANGANWIQSLNAEKNERNWRAAAAMLGPGIRGERVEMSDSDRASAAMELLSNWDASYGDAPAFLREISEGIGVDWIERRAKLFECGEYSDRGVSVSPSDLQRLAMSFDSPVPVLIEHIESPFRLGYLTDVEAIGPELFGTLALTKEANDLVEECAAKSLSISVGKSLDKIHEVSIVANPRIHSARLFCENFRDLAPTEGWKREAIELRERIEREEIARTVAAFNLAPAIRRSAVALLEVVKDPDAKERALTLIASIPKAVHFGELAPSGPVSSHDLSAEEAQFYAQHFPGINPRDIAKRRI